MSSLPPLSLTDAQKRIADLEHALADCTRDLQTVRLLLSDCQARAGGTGSALGSVALRLPPLTARQRQVMTLVLAGHPSKNIAVDIGISQRTVENHRAAIMRKTGATSIPALVRLALDAGWDDKRV